MKSSIRFDLTGVQVEHVDNILQHSNRNMETDYDATPKSSPKFRSKSRPFDREGASTRVRGRIKEPFTAAPMGHITKRDN